jgi:lipoate-protein ligase A
MQPHPWYFLASGPGIPAFNMALDEALLQAMPRLGRPMLRFYSWTEPAASFGYFQRYAAVERLTALRPLVRRPTGGGIVPHDTDWTYSLAFPPNDPWYALRATESYRRVHEWIQAAFARLGIVTKLAPACQKTALGQCFVGYEKSDLLWHGQKIAGAAQRRTRDGLLVQGSVHPPQGSLARTVWQGAMRDVGRETCGADWVELEPDASLANRAQELIRLKYSQPAYNRKR